MKERKLNLRLIAGILIVFALTIAFKNVTICEATGSFFRDTIRYFMYFTMLSNISAAVYFIGKGLHKKGFFFENTNVRFTIMTAMLLTSIIYFAMLFKVEPTLLDNIANFILHCFCTIFIFIDYFVTCKKGTLKLSAPIKWSSIFLFYVPYTLILAKLVNWYPYPFIDLNLISVSTLILNVILVIVAFTILGYLLLLLDKLIAKINKR